MIKITLKGLISMFCIFGILTINAQEKRTINLSGKTPVLKAESTKNNNGSVNVNNIALQLTPENQKSLEETGYVRCVSVEMDARRQQRAGVTGYNDAFENWLAPLVEAKRQKIAKQKANGTFKKVVVNVPVIFHVITSGGNHPTNLSQALIQGQIDQLNLDFSNQGGVNGASSGNAAAADAEIVFIPAMVDPNGNTLAEPGIDRVTTFGAGSFARTDFDLGDGGLEIKPATIWDRSLYANIWTADITGGILGYAQFPSNSTLPGFPANGGDQLNDGVVCGYGTIGSRDLPGSAAPYNLGRTLTHEIGHWIGLRHIWGDNWAQGSPNDQSCNVDDYCNDTPNAGRPNFGCTQGTDTCPGSTGDDMIENYMDYTDDLCMDIFTADQVLRIVTVLENADGISNLPNSTTGSPAIPSISFSSTTSSVIEGSDCSFTDVTVPLTIGVGASQSATATFSVSSTTGTDGVDFQLMTTTASFAAGATSTSEDMVLRVYNDSFIESDETVTIGFTVNANEGDAVAGNNTLTLTINDDDVQPTANSNITVFNDDFSDGDASDWTGIDNNANAADDWNLVQESNWTTPFGIYTNYFLASYSWNGVNYSPDNFITSPLISVPAGASNINLRYFAGSGNDGNFFSENYEVYISNAAGSVANILAGTRVVDTVIPAVGGAYYDVDLSTFSGQDIFVSFRHHDTTGEWVLGIDEVSITADVSAMIQTAVNNATNDSLNLTTSGTVYTADSATGNVMLDITNNNTFNYGCTTVEVSREGNTAQSYSGSSAPNLVMDKTFSINPTNTTTTGNTNITFYFTEAEIAGWETATGLSRIELAAFREGTNDIVTLSGSAFGTYVTLTGDFTGLSGVYFFGSANAFRTIVSPKVYLQGAMLNSPDGLMRDDLRAADMIPTTSPYDATTCNATVFNTTGNNAIVDWILVELRSASDNTIVIESKSALLQRDGDIVDVDGTSALVFDQAPGNFYVAVKHKNHLGIVTLNPVALSSGVTTVDYTNATSQITYGANAQSTFGMPTDTIGMWAGNVSGDIAVRYQGSDNDANTIKDNVLADAGNASNSNLHAFTKYDNGDVDMNGTIRYQGSGNDSNTIKDIVLSHPDNQATPSNLFVITEQLPEN